MGMYSNISIKIRTSFKLFIMLFLFSMLFLSTTVYAAVPYTYEVNTNKLNTIDITFDYDISFDAKDKDKITIYQTTASGSIIGKIPSTILRDLTLGITASGTVLSIKIATLDPGAINYAIKIEKDALTFNNTTYTPLTDFILPFSTIDFAEGFKSTFLDNETALNDDIFKYNSTRDVSIYVPKKYITSIEAIHKKDGLIKPGTTPTYTRLTNIDVKTDTSVKRVKVSITKLGTTTSIMGEKDLLPSSSAGGFTTGAAGVDIDITRSDYTINVRAFDANGKLIEYSHYNKKLVAVKTEIVSDYVEKTNTSLNKTITLYDLMKTPATLAALLTSYDPDNLDSVKVTYPNDKHTRIVSNSEGQSNDAANVLAEALEDPNVQYIRFASALNITPTDSVKLARTVATSGKIILDGNGSTINGDVTIGCGDTDGNTYELRNITIKGNLTINLSETGEYLLTNNSTATKTIINGKKTSAISSIVSMEDKILYKIGDTIKIGVKFNEAIFVSGKPILKLSIGDALYDKEGTDLVATQDVIVFKYVVVAGSKDFKLETYENSIILDGGYIQPRDGASKAFIPGTLGSIVKLIYNTDRKSIDVDTLIPMAGTTIVVPSTIPQVITCIANDILDKTSAEIATNWKIKKVGGADFTPEKVILNGDKRTVTIVMPTDFSLANGVSIKVIMTDGIKDKSGNLGDSLVH